ncbi:MAG TPA: glycoside hydrolase family 2 protein [Clostridiales bacterium]|nr:glycoside hydrolase family 2 protein [Clostridiales bacterium]
MKERINLNNGWKYNQTFHEEMTERSYDDSNFEIVRIPHTNVVTPFNYFEEEIYQFISCYRKKIFAKDEWRGKQVLITFEAVAHVAKVYLNGKLLMVHEGGYTSFTLDLGPHLMFGEDNTIIVGVDSRESNNLPPFGNVIDYLTYGGIYREVYIDIKDTISIEEVFIMTRDIENSKEKGSKEVELWITTHGILKENIGHYHLAYFIKDFNDSVIFQSKDSILGETTKIKFCIDKVLDWDLDNPNLYCLNVKLIENNKDLQVDENKTRFGFRTCEFKGDGFYLNNKKIKLIGLNRHQSYPYVGYAMPKRMQERDAQILKNELGVNAVRTSHYPQSKHFINHCDEIGLLVFTEIPGWQHIGDESWKNIACENVHDMVIQYRNHPSIVLWGVRINESQDDNKFYAKTNQIAHELDPGRQTGGVRDLKKSSFLEDVYTFNDFIHNGTLKGLNKKKDVTSKLSVPYMVTEFNGHMFPTKAFDDEKHRLDHALRHACVLDALFEQKAIAGGFGWCMFDYNTHKDFGSGDKICYHGVMDMFRNPKIAAAVYASQSDDINVCEVSSTLDIGEHASGNIGDVFVFTNADSIKLYKNNDFVKEFYPSKTKYSHLPHPPVIIDDFVGNLLVEKENYTYKTAESIKKVLFAVKQFGPNNLPLKHKLRMAWLMMKEKLELSDGARLYYKYIGSWGGEATTFKFEAIKNGKTIKTIKKRPAGYPKLDVKVSDTKLIEGTTYDVVDIRIQAVDGSGNILPYYQEPITFDTWGTVELIGPKTVSLKGGSVGTYVKTKGIKGEGGISISNETRDKVEIKFNVE